jgi:hypothetical protein
VRPDFPVSADRPRPARIAVLLLGVEATSGTEDVVWGAALGFLFGAVAGRIVERIVARLILLALTLLLLYARFQSLSGLLGQ